MSSDDELLDLVNEQDEIIGTIWRSKAPELAQTKAGFIRASSMFLRNSEGKIWVPKRTADKVIAPNGLDFSVGGHVESGHTYQGTIVKEAQEEINLTLLSENLHMIKQQKPHGYYICQIFIYAYDKTPRFNPNDFVSARWLTVAELLTELRAGTPAKTSLLPTVEEIFTPEGALRDSV